MTGVTRVPSRIRLVSRPSAASVTHASVGPGRPSPSTDPHVVVRAEERVEPELLGELRHGEEFGVGRALLGLGEDRASRMRRRRNASSPQTVAQWARLRRALAERRWTYACRGAHRGPLADARPTADGRRAVRLGRRGSRRRRRGHGVARAAARRGPVRDARPHRSPRPATDPTDGALRRRRAARHRLAGDPVGGRAASGATSCSCTVRNRRCGGPRSRRRSSTPPAGSASSTR